VRVFHGEGLANHIGPESCADSRETAREALTGEHAGQPLSHESFITPGADVFSTMEGNMDRCDIASTCSTWRGRRPWHAWTLFVREPGGLVISQIGTLSLLVRIGKARSRSR